MVKQDLHIHTTFSSHDRVIVPEQTLELIAQIKHAKIIGISDHFESIRTKKYPAYREAVLSHNFKLGIEIGGHRSVKEATELEFDYHIYHCRDKKADYQAIEKLLETGKPLIIAHPYAFGTKLGKIPAACYIEINNRYIWRYNWRNYLAEHVHRFKFLLSSDAHQPNWLNQNVARYVAGEMGIEETILF